MTSHAGNTSPTTAQSGPPSTSAAASGAASTSGANTNTGSSWAEPPWSGWIETTGDALIILEAARRGLIPRVTRRLVDSERKMITSGSVFVFDEDESGIKRWTDGFFWSPSRILGNFLLYRETDKRGQGHRGGRRDNEDSSSNSLLVNETNQYGDANKDHQSLSRPKGELNSLGIDKHRERSLVGSLTNSYKFKPDGMMKKTFSLTIGGVSQHLISYYKIEDVEQGRLRTPSSLPELASLDISPEYLDKTHFRNPPKVEYDLDGIPRYRGEADEAEPSPRATITAPLSTGQPLLLESRGDPDHDAGGKRTKRYDPYSTGSKRRKGKGIATSGSGDGQIPSPTNSVPISGQSAPPGMYGGTEQQHQHQHYTPYHGVNYYPYGMPQHVSYVPQGTYSAPIPTSSPTSVTGANNGATASPPPAAQATGVVSPAPNGTAITYPGYTTAAASAAASESEAAASQTTGGTSNQTHTSSAPAYTFYPSPPGHYAPYGSVAWPPYTYGSSHGMSSTTATVGKSEEEGDGLHSHAHAHQAQRAIATEDA